MLCPVKRGQAASVSKILFPQPHVATLWHLGPIFAKHSCRAQHARSLRPECRRGAVPLQNRPI